jgi:site-specific DNA recombinase
MTLRLPDLDLPADLLGRLTALSCLDGIPSVMYARISRDKVGAHLGADRQLEDQCPLYALRGLRLVGVYVDNDISAYSGKPRPDYNAMLAELKAAEAKVVTTWHPDRLHRSPVELEAYIAVCDPADIPTLTVRAGEIDLSTANGRMIARVTGAIARHESEQKSERVSAQKRQAAAAGKWRGGTRPYAYESDGVTHRASEVELLHEIAKRLIAGEGLYAISRDLEARGVRSPQGKEYWSPVNLRTVILNPRNAGLTSHRGRIVAKAEWEPIFDEPTWDAINSLLVTGQLPWNRGNMSKKMLGSGLYLCEDGRTMFSGGTTRAGKSRYRCAANHNCRTAKPIDDYVLDVVSRALAAAGERLLPAAEDMAPIYEQLAALKLRQTDLAMMFADPRAALTGAQFAAANRAIAASMDDLRATVERSQGAAVLSGVADADDPAQEFLDASMDRQRSIIDSVCVVTIHRATPGRAGFDRKSVEISPKRGKVNFG